MSLVRSIGRNTIIQFGGKIFSIILGLVTFGLIERYLGPEGFGRYTFAMAYLGTISVIADLGLHIIYVRELNKPGADQSRITGNVLAIRWTSALIILSLGAAAAFSLNVERDVHISIVIGAVSFFVIAATQLLTGLYQTKLDMIKVVTGETAGRIVLLALTWYAVTQSMSLPWIIGAVAVGSIVNFLIMWTMAWRYISLRLRFDFGYWKYILVQVFPITISVILNLIYFRADTLILKAFSTDYYVGLYGAAYKILEILLTFPIMFAGLLLPVLSFAFTTNDHQRFTSIYQRGFELLFMAAMPILVGGAILAEPLLVAIGTEAYAPAAPVLRLLLIAVVAAFLNGFATHSVTIIGRQKKMVWSYLAAAVLGLTLYLTLVPRYGMYGAAIGTIFTESLVAVIAHIFVLRAMHFRLRFTQLPKVALATLVMGATAWLLREQNFYLAALASAVTYGIMIVMVKALPLATIKEILGASRAPAAVPLE